MQRLLTTRTATDRRGRAMPELGTVGEIDHARIVGFDWKVRHFYSLRDVQDGYYRSPVFRFKGDPCWVSFYPAGDSTSGGAYVSLHLVWEHSPLSTPVQCSAGIITARGETVMVFSQRMQRGLAFSMCDKSQWILRSELLRRRDELMPLGKLTIAVSFRETEDRFNVASVRDGNLADACVQTVEDDRRHELEGKAGIGKVLKDIGKLWTSGDNSDVVMKVRGVEFEAHRAILRIRAPVLGAMFQHDTTEEALGEVIIDDCEPAVFEQLLHYIYTGAPRELTAENAAALYVAAELYQVSEVKALCLQCMKDTICVDRFCEVVTLSLLYSEEELFSVAVGFMSEHMLDVMQTVQWQEFSRECSTWANEILIRTLKFQAENKEG